MIRNALHKEVIAKSIPTTAEEPGKAEFAVVETIDVAALLRNQFPTYSSAITTGIHTGKF